MENKDKDFNYWYPLPSRLSKLTELREAGHTIGVASNQGGVAFGLVTKQEVINKLCLVSDYFSIDKRFIRCCFTHPIATVEEYKIENGRRKPNPDMIKEIMENANHDPLETVYIGDMKVDQDAAKNAGVLFKWSYEFFGDKP
jgi:HAD superfamily hydrolase (TIGR01662 family)